MRYASLITAIGVFSLVACSSPTAYGGGGTGGGVSSSGGHSTTITVANDFFSPTPDTIPAGGVNFTWATPSAGHTLIWDSGPGTLPQDISATTTSGSFSFNNLQPGTYQYHCSIHGAPGVGMHGTIIVQ